MAKVSVVALPGSDKQVLTGSTFLRPVDPSHQISVTVVVRGRGRPSDAAVMKLGAELPAQRRILTREAFDKDFGARPQDVGRVEEFIHSSGLTIVSWSSAYRRVRITGAVRAFCRAFGVELNYYKKRPNLIHRGRRGPIYIPRWLKGIILRVHGLDNRPMARATVRA